MGIYPLRSCEKKEGELFGSSDEGVGRSKFALKIIGNPQLKTDSYRPVPTRTFETKAFVPEQSFTLSLSANNNFKEYDKICNLLKISMLLGGLGKRSRRGFGSVKITQIDGNPASQYNSIDDLCSLLDLIKPDTFVLNKTKIERIRPVHAEAEYPYIKEIEIGTISDSWKDLVKKIGAASHEFDCYHTGFVNPYRFASPVYVSIIRDNNGQYLPIISTLNCAFKESIDLPDAEKKKDNTKKFKDAILS